MSATLGVLRAGPLTSIQDLGRFGMLRHGISASGPMDGAAFLRAGIGGFGAIEITTAGIELGVTSAQCRVSFAGGQFKIKINGVVTDWPGVAEMKTGDVLAVTPGPQGNYGYLRFDADIVADAVMGSIATSSRAKIGGHAGRTLQAGDVIKLADSGNAPVTRGVEGISEGPIRIVWGVHADLFAPAVRAKFLENAFTVSARMDRMGVRLDDKAGVFANSAILSLVSDAIVPGDIQILGDGTPIVLMRDHQPTGGYPRIATIITADLDRFAQIRPGRSLAFNSVSIEHAHQLLRRHRP